MSRPSLSRRFREPSDSAGLLLDDASAFRRALPVPERGSGSLDLPVNLFHIFRKYGERWQCVRAVGKVWQLEIKTWRQRETEATAS